MRMRAQIILVFAILVSWLTGMGGCSTTHIDPQAVLPAEPPEYVKVPHPDGLDEGDLQAIFHTKGAPEVESLKECDKDFMKLHTLTQSRDEQLQGARELVKADPIAYHWCFYSKLLVLETQLKKDLYVDEKQKVVLSTFIFLGPIAQAYLQEFNDSRYLRWAVARYRRLSEYVFYRNVELTPDATQNLLTAENPFGLARQPAELKSSQSQGVLEKYGIVKVEPQVVSGSSPAAAVPASTPASDKGGVVSPK